jgi:hypothetical protein
MIDNIFLCECKEMTLDERTFNCQMCNIKKCLDCETKNNICSKCNIERNNSLLALVKEDPADLYLEIIGKKTRNKKNKEKTKPINIIQKEEEIKNKYVVIYKDKYQLCNTIEDIAIITNKSSSCIARLITNRILFKKGKTIDDLKDIIIAKII